MSYAPTRLLYKAVLAAYSEALRLGHNFIGPEHLIVGLLQVEDGIASTVFDELEVDRAELRGVLDDRLPEPETTPLAGELPYTQAGASVLKGAMAEADDESVTYMSTGHLLMAVFDAEAWPGDRGTSVVELRERVERVAAASKEHDDLLSEEPEGGNHL